MLIDFCNMVCRSSTLYEVNNTELKKEYLKEHILLFNEIAKEAGITKGTFGTGYPFDSLGADLNGTLPIIQEQIRYNNELMKYVYKSKHASWACEECLSRNYSQMKDLKSVCLPCPNMDDELKPRKLMNRLPDVDLWAIYSKEELIELKKQLEELFINRNLVSSDIDPVGTMRKVSRIASSISNGVMPVEYLPLDAHLIDYADLYSLIERTPGELDYAVENNKKAYLPIHPESFRKVWQKDDVAYNFIVDYLISFTGYDLAPNMQVLLDQTRSYIASKYSPFEIYDIIYKTSGDARKRRIREAGVKEVIKERVLRWK